MLLSGPAMKEHKQFIIINNQLLRKSALQSKEGLMQSRNERREKASNLRGNDSVMTIIRVSPRLRVNKWPLPLFGL